MPIYHFNMHDGKEYPDTLGHELPDLTSARVEAVRFIAAHLVDDAERFWDGDEWTLQVTDHNGLILFTLIFSAFAAPATYVEGRS